MKSFSGLFLYAFLLLMLSLSLVGSVYAIVNVTDVDAASIAPGEQGADGQYSDTTAGSLVSQGGNLTEVNLSGVYSSNKWQGYYGLLNGSISIGDGSSTLFNFGAVKVNLVMAVLDPNFNFGALRNDTTNATNGQTTYLNQEIDKLFFNTSSSDPRTYRDSANRTFIPTTRSTAAGTKGFNILALPNQAGGTSVFRTYIGHNGSVLRNAQDVGSSLQNAFAFFGTKTAVGTSFKGVPADYEILVPTPIQGNTPGYGTYYFFLDVE